MELAVRDGHVLLRIVDDGVGMTPERHYSGGMGLISMRERVSVVGGTCKVTSGSEGHDSRSVGAAKRGAANRKINEVLLTRRCSRLHNYCFQVRASLPRLPNA